MTPRASLLVCFLLIVGCSSTSSTGNDAADGPSPDASSADAPSPDGASPEDGAIDGGAMCIYEDGGAAGDGGTFNSKCPTAGCPNGTVCVVEIGGVAGGGGEYCAPIPGGCHGAPTCACMAACVCTSRVGIQPEACSERNGMIACDNGIR